MLFRLISFLILAALLIVGAVLASVLILAGGLVLAMFLVRLWWRSHSGTASVTRKSRAGADLIEGEYTVERESAAAREASLGADTPLVPEDIPRHEN